MWVKILQKRYKIDKKKLERFEFKPVLQLRAKVKTDPEIATNLKANFNTTLEAQGIVIDDNFKTKVQTQWREQIRTDVKRVAEANKDKNWYLNKVLEGKPIKVSVKVDKKTGSHVKKPKEES